MSRELFRCHLFLAAILALSANSLTSIAGEPQVLDPRFEISLFAEHPQIVTPIGAAVDARDRLFVVESHTHHPPSDYSGPKTDRIKVFEDKDGDGKSERNWIFADGFAAAMNIAFDRAGRLYVVCSHSVWMLSDEDCDGVADQRRQLLRLETTERYAHSCLLSIAIDDHGWLYIGRGNTGSRAWTLIGTYESKVSGYGDGGNIVRCRSDGSQLEEFATGFWNPFDISFDNAGRLLCVDNDPDARGPNRLLHVVQHGDYGYRSLFGGGGNHPYQAWNGELPGTLPYISGTGEAPSGLLVANTTALKGILSDSLLVTVWNEHTIERHQLRPRGASLAADRTVLIRGEKEFRPVAIVADSRGYLYITDWVLVDYPNHGRGRIWRVRSKDAVGIADNANTPKSQDVTPTLNELVESDDPFLHHAGILRLVADDDVFRRQQLMRSSNPRVRLAALLAVNRRGDLTEEGLRTLLKDDDADVRLAAMLAVGDLGLRQLRRDLKAAVVPENTTPKLAETYVATLALLDEYFITARKKKASDKSRDLLPKLERSQLVKIIRDGTVSYAARVYALSRLTVSISDQDWLIEIAQNNGSAIGLRRSAIEKLGMLEKAPGLMAIVYDGQTPTSLRADAIAAIGRGTITDRSWLFRMRSLGRRAEDGRSILIEGARAFANWQPTDEMKRRASRYTYRDFPDEVREAIRLALQQSEPLPTDIEQWESMISNGGDVDAGRRVFLSPRAACTQCHDIDGVDGTLGPSLSNIGQSRSREQIIRSILEPSKEFAPQYQAWQVITNDGRFHSGLQLDHKARGAIEMMLVDGNPRRFEADEVEDYLASPQSIMPDGLEQNLTVSEMRDLVAFLESRR